MKYVVSFNGKARFNLDFPAGTSSEEVEKTVLANETAQKWMEGKTPKKVIIVPNKIVNIVL
jgi:leucyl-tRNA synthetase